MIITAGGLYGTVQSLWRRRGPRRDRAGRVRARRRGAIATVLTEEDDELEELERAQQEAQEEVLAARDAGER